MTLKQYAEDVYDAVSSYYGEYMAEAPTKYSSPWDAEQSMGCWCDSGRSGADCSIKDCPSVDDVMGGPGHEATCLLRPRNVRRIYWCVHLLRRILRHGVQPAAQHHVVKNSISILILLPVPLVACCTYVV